MACDRELSELALVNFVEQFRFGDELEVVRHVRGQDRLDYHLRAVRLRWCGWGAL